MLVGLGQWLSQGGLNRPIPTPIGYWVGIGLVVAGVGLTIYGWRYGGKLIRKENEGLLDGIRSVLIDIDKCENDAAIKKTKRKPPKDLMERIARDFTEVFGSLAPFLASMLDNILGKGNIDYLINFFAKLGDIMDTEDFGLKSELSYTDEYANLNADLAKKRANLQLKEKKRRLVEKNIDRVRVLTYGVHSSRVFRQVLKAIPEAKALPRESMVILESMEAAMGRILPKMLATLDVEWKNVEININEL